jgi:hypothetical protein
MAEGHDRRGRFTKGNPGNPNAKGRPRREAERAYLEATVASVSIDDWKKVVKKALAQAIARDDRARCWLSRLLVGDNPLQMAELIEELQAELDRLRGYGGAGSASRLPYGLREIPCEGN